MNKTGKASEPSMDEILASIRKIIAEEPATPRAATSGASRRPEPLTADAGSRPAAAAARPAATPAVRAPIALDDDLDDLIDGPTAPVAARAEPVVPAVKPVMTAAAARLAAKSATDEPQAKPAAANGAAHAASAPAPAVTQRPAAEEPAKSNDLGAFVPRRETPSMINGSARQPMGLSPDLPMPPADRLAIPASPERAAASATPADPVATKPVDRADAGPASRQGADTPEARAPGQGRVQLNGAERPADKTQNMPAAEAAPAAEAMRTRSGPTLGGPTGSDEHTPAASAPLASFSASLASQTARAAEAKSEPKTEAVATSARPDVKPETKADVKPETSAAPSAATAAGTDARDAGPTARPVGTSAPQPMPRPQHVPAAPTPVSATSAPAAATQAPTATPAPAVMPATTPTAPAGSLPAAATIMGTPATRTLEDTVAELLRPMLRQWLDANMPRIVEKALRVELAQMGPKTVVVQKPPSQN